MNVSFVSLGCDKNRVNTEQMMALCLQAGITVQEDCPGSDVVVINTCGFIDSAKSEAIDTILSAAQLKDAGEIQKILVTGCLSQRYQADILEELPEIDGIMGTGCFGDIVPALEQVMNGQECRHFADINGPVEELPRVLSTPRHYAYLRIAEGCSNRCAYCVIPSLRGNYRSRRMEDILAEARALADDGVRECIVIAQDITRYGMDLYGERKLPELLRALCRLPFHWIRLHYLYPDNLSDELIDTIAGEEKICNYLDIPIQHCNDAVLKAMPAGRPRRGWRPCLPGCGTASQAWCCAPASSPACPMRTRPPSRSCAAFWGSRSSSGWGPLPTPRRRAPLRRRCSTGWTPRRPSAGRSW